VSTENLPIPVTRPEKLAKAYAAGYAETREMMAEEYLPANIRGLASLCVPKEPDLPPYEAETALSVYRRCVEDALNNSEACPLWGDFDQPLLDLSEGELCPPMRISRNWL
jgi:hypothetical protein